MELLRNRGGEEARKGILPGLAAWSPSSQSRPVHPEQLLRRHSCGNAERKGRQAVHKLLLASIQASSQAYHKTVAPQNGHF